MNKYRAKYIEWMKKEMSKNILRQDDVFEMKQVSNEQLFVAALITGMLPLLVYLIQHASVLWAIWQNRGIFPDSFVDVLGHFQGFGPIQIFLAVLPIAVVLVVFVISSNITYTYLRIDRGQLLVKTAMDEFLKRPGQSQLTQGMTWKIRKRRNRRWPIEDLVLTVKDEQGQTIEILLSGDTFTELGIGALVQWLEKHQR